MEVPNPTLPDELVSEILLRLPVKPICRFKCVSKPWRSHLSSHQFARAYSKLHDDNYPEDLILTSSSSDHAPYILTLGGGADDSTAAAVDGKARKVPFQVNSVGSRVGGSCDGLILFLLPRSNCRKLVFNPITLETADIRDDRPLNLRSCVYGFGYDSSVQDYKIVSITAIPGISGSFVDVYSLRGKCWRSIGPSPYVLQDSPFDAPECYRDHDPAPGPAPGVYLNGCVHWFGKDSRDEEAGHEIVCFNLAREEFEEGLLPETVMGDSAFEIRVLNGCLALVSEPYYLTDSFGVDRMAMDVFVMREYGVRDSWTEFTTIWLEEEFDEEGDPFDQEYKVVCVLNEDEILLEKKRVHLEQERQQLVAYSRRSGVSRELAISGLPAGFSRVMPFRGSILSPN